ncbi:MAG: hypothetical protein LBH25_05510 [Fibromonadaceae bacterium]|jgi:hypothetical protein|nr:hypothetical protein [Fibromonadaceae bacterium]
MSFLFPSYSVKYSKISSLKHWVKVWVLLVITGLLTWYGKIYKPPPSLTYVNDFAIWVVPHKNGLGALIALPNDNNDSTSERTGLRIWVQPPDSILAFERNGVRYRGKNIVVIGDSLGDALKQDLLSTLDSNGNFFWISNLGREYTGEDVHAELKLFGGKPQDYLLDLVYEGHKLRFFGSQTAVDSAAEEPLSVAALMFKQANENEPPFKDSRQIQSLIWNGKSSRTDPSRVALNYEEAFALVSFSDKLGLRVKRMHFKNWNPEL